MDCTSQTSDHSSTYTLHNSLHYIYTFIHWWYFWELTNWHNQWGAIESNLGFSISCTHRRSLVSNRRSSAQWPARSTSWATAVVANVTTPISHRYFYSLTAADHGWLARLALTTGSCNPAGESLWLMLPEVAPPKVNVLCRERELNLGAQLRMNVHRIVSCEKRLDREKSYPLWSRQSVF